MAVGSGGTLSHYRIVEKIGAGGMGVVYLAKDEHLDGREVAIKVLPAGALADGAARARFRKEAIALSKLNHPNIATIHDFDTEGEIDFIVMEFVPGETLNERLAAGALPEEEVERLGIQFAEGLAAAHATGIVHRDLKPGNLRITPDGRLKILDFGLARAVAPDPIPEIEKAADTAPISFTRPGAVIGTLPYLSPEQASGMKANPRSDVFSAGAVLYEMASGVPAFASTSRQETLRRILSTEPRPLQEIKPRLSPALIGVIRRALSKDPARRYASGAELAAALEKPDESRAAVVSAGTAATRGGRKRLLGLVAAIIAIGALTGTYIWWASRPALAFSTRDVLLIADVENHTGNPVFDIALKTALVTDLRQSPYANVFDENQITQTLRLMRRDPTTRIDEEIGRDICRYAGVKALLIPQIVSVGNAFDLQAILIDPTDGRRVDRVRVTAEGAEEVLLTAVDALSREIRSRLGESLQSIEETDPPISAYTTSSWEAMRLMTLGHRRSSQLEFKEAADLFRRALDEDPHFAAASGSLGLLLIQFLDEQGEGIEMLGRALADSNDVSKREYLLIRAIHREFVEKDLEGALDDYRVISDLYPDLMQPYNNSGAILRNMGRSEEAVAMFERAASANSLAAYPLINLYWTQLRLLRDPPAAEKAARRLVALDSQVSNYRSMLAWSFLAQHRFAEAEASSREIVKDEPAHLYAQPNLAHLLLARGAAREALAVYREVCDPVRRRQTIGAEANCSVYLAVALTVAGERAEAERLLVEMLEKTTLTTQDGVDGLVRRAVLEAALGRREEAVALVERALAGAEDDAPTRLEAARVYALLGEKKAALDHLRVALAGRIRDRYFPLIDPAFHSLFEDSDFRALFPSGRGSQDARADAG